MIVVQHVSLLERLLLARLLGSFSTAILFAVYSLPLLLTRLRARITAQ